MVPSSEDGEEAVLGTKDPLGDRMKGYERAFDTRFMPLCPVVARLDGKGFSKWTAGMEKPYDLRLAAILQETLRWLVEKTGAAVGYGQSDEMTLLFHSEDYKKQLLYDARKQKLDSVLAAMATARFNELARETFLERPLAFFDCRTFQVPNEDEAANAVLWREFDASKNSVTSLARCHFSHARIQGLSTKEMQDLLFAEAGINWNDCPATQKRGWYFQRRTVRRPLSPEESARIPEAHRIPAGTLLERSEVMLLELPRLATVTNRTGVLLRGEEPRTD